MTKEEYIKDKIEEFASKAPEGFVHPEEIEFIEQIFDEDIEPREKRIAELEEQIEKVKHYLDYDIPLDFINEATIKICGMLK